MPIGWLGHAATYFCIGGAISWSFSTLSAAAKNRMTSISGYFRIETMFTALQWGIVAALTAALVRG